VDLVRFLDKLDERADERLNLRRFDGWALRRPWLYASAFATSVTAMLAAFIAMPGGSSVGWVLVALGWPLLFVSVGVVGSRPARGDGS
jgi:uncharacterized RDD family membrane protein YckC